MATYTIYPVQTVTQPSVLSNAIEGADVVVSAVLAGIILYFLNKSFLNNFPSYIAIISGFLLVMYLGNHMILKNLGFVLLVDGIYKLIREYVTVSS
jgi:protein-S-isoprenylcysteine O-methyltransferase Ste14